MNERTTTLALRGRELLFLLGVIVVGFFMFGGSASRAPISSAEVQFTDPSASGLAIVPASCPSSPHYDGQCSQRCTPLYYCAGPSGNDRYYRDGQCNESFVETCRWGCANGQCLPAEGMTFVPFTGYRDGNSFDASGHIQINPSIVRSGDATRVYWYVDNAASCVVTGTNGDRWEMSHSGANGQITGPIVQQVVYTLTCYGHDGTTPSVITENAVVNIVPGFVET